MPPKPPNHEEAPAKKTSRRPPPPKSPEPQVPDQLSSPAISIEQFLEYQQKMLGDGDVLLVVQLRVLTKTTEICKINVNTTLPMLLTSQQMSQAPSTIEDQLHRTILVPVVGVFQRRVEEAQKALTEEPTFLSPPTIPRALPPTPPPSNASGSTRDHIGVPEEGHESD